MSITISNKLPQGISVSSLTQTTLSPAIDVVSSAFLDEKTTAALGFNYNDCVSVFRPMAQQALEQNMGLVAKEGDKVIAAIFSQDANLPEAPLENETHILSLREPEAPIYEELESTKAFKDLKKQYPKAGELFNIGWGGTKANFRGQNIFSELIESTLVIAQKKGFKAAIAYATSEGTQKILERLGFYKLSSIPYSKTSHLHQPYRQLAGEFILYGSKLNRFA